MWKVFLLEFIIVFVHDGINYCFCPRRKMYVGCPLFLFTTDLKIPSDYSSSRVGVVSDVPNFKHG